MMQKLFKRKSRSLYSIAISIVVLSSSCSQNAEIDAVCDLADSWNLASTGFAQVSADFETTSPGRLRVVLVTW